MAIFSINGQETDDVRQALQLVEDIWHESKTAAVEAQHAAALQKPSALDLERAARGVPAPVITAASAAKTLATRAEAAAVAAAAEPPASE